MVTFYMHDFLAGLDMHGFACWCMVLLFWVASFCRVMTMAFSLAFPFMDALVCWDVYLSFELYFTGWISEFGAEVVSSFIPKGRGIHRPVLVG